MTRAYVAIGSNIDREENVRVAVEQLQERFSPVVVSAIYDTVSIGFDGDNFYNLVVGFDTDLSARELDANLRQIEADRGRGRSAERYSPRTLDLDLLLYGDLIGEVDGMRLPRVDIERFAFVLAPLAEIAPDQRHPVLGKTYRQMWFEFDPDGKTGIRLATGT